MARLYHGNSQKTCSQANNSGGEKRSEILSTLNKYNDTTEDLVDSLNMKHPAILGLIASPSNDIPASENISSDLEVDNDILN